MASFPLCLARMNQRNWSREDAEVRICVWSAITVPRPSVEPSEGSKLAELPVSLPVPHISCLCSHSLTRGLYEGHLASEPSLPLRQE